MSPFLPPSARRGPPRTTSTRKPTSGTPPRLHTLLHWIGLVILCISARIACFPTAARMGASPTASETGELPGAKAPPSHQQRPRHPRRVKHGAFACYMAFKSPNLRQRVLFTTGRGRPRALPGRTYEGPDLHFAAPNLARKCTFHANPMWNKGAPRASVPQGKGDRGDSAFAARSRPAAGTQPQPSLYADGRHATLPTKVSFANKPMVSHDSRQGQGVDPSDHAANEVEPSLQQPLPIVKEGEAAAVPPDIRQFYRALKVGAPPPAVQAKLAATLGWADAKAERAIQCMLDCLSGKPVSWSWLSAPKPLATSSTEPAPPSLDPLLVQLRGSDAVCALRRALSVGVPPAAVAARAAASLCITHDTAQHLVSLLSPDEATVQAAWGSMGASERSGALQVVSAGCRPPEPLQRKPVGEKAAAAADDTPYVDVHSLPTLTAFGRALRVGAPRGAVQAKVVAALKCSPEVAEGLVALLKPPLDDASPVSVWRDFPPSMRRAVRRAVGARPDVPDPPSPATRPPHPPKPLQLRRFGWTPIAEPPPESIWRELQETTDINLLLPDMPLDAMASPDTGAGETPGASPAAAAETGGEGAYAERRLTHEAQKAELLEEFRQMFKQVKLTAQPRRPASRPGGSAATPRTGRGAAKATKPLALEPKRQMNMGIAWKRIGLTKKALLRVLSTLDNTGAEGSAKLDDVQLQLLPSLALTPTELTKLQSATQPQPAASTLEQLAVSMAAIPRLNARLQALAATASFPDRAKEVVAQLTTLRDAVKVVRASTELRTVLRAALLLAKTLALSKQDDSHIAGVCVTSLIRLERTKATDGRSTALHYLERVVSALNDRAVGEFHAQVTQGCVATASRLTFAAIEGELQSMQREVDATTSLVHALSCSSSGTVAAFATTAPLDLQRLKGLLDHVKGEFSALCTYYVLDPNTKPAAWFGALGSLGARLAVMAADRTRWARRGAKKHANGAQGRPT